VSSMFSMARVQWQAQLGVGVERDVAGRAVGREAPAVERAGQAAVVLHPSQREGHAPVRAAIDERAGHAVPSAEHDHLLPGDPEADRITLHLP